MNGFQRGWRGVVGVAIGALSMAGCRDQGRPVHAYIGFDTSGSTRSLLGVYSLLAARLAAHLEPDTDRLTLYRVDERCMEFADGPAPESEERLLQAVVPQLRPRPDRSGTFPGRFWREVAGRAAVSQEKVVIVLFSDGDSDDTESAPAIRRAAAALAANRNVVSVAVVGASPANWGALREEMAPLGDRLTLCSPSELTVDPVVDRLEAAR